MTASAEQRPELPSLERDDGIYVLELGGGE
jgi:hypothetical protein